MKEKLSSIKTRLSKEHLDIKMFIKGKENKYQVLFSLFGVLLAVIGVVGVSYATWTKTSSGGNNSISTGTITMRYVENTSVASINNATPMSASDAYQSNNYFPFQVVMEASGNATLNYEVTITTQDTTTYTYDIDQKVRIGLKKENNIITDAGFNIEGSQDNVDYTDGVIVGTLPTTGTSLTGNPQTIYKGTITSNGTETVDNFKLYLWLDSNATATDISEKYAFTINVNTGDTAPNYQRYTLTYSDDEGTGCTTKQVRRDTPWGELCTPTADAGYHFQGWYTGQDGTGTQITSTTTASANQTVYAYYTSNTLYYVLKKASKVGTYARKYTGEHQDSMDPTKSTKDIYHWYGSNDTNGTAILDKNNVIFANHCWQMIRTTDTGGVRMIYNGEVEDGKCLNTRGNHVGYGGITSQSLNGTYWYGTDYTYNNGIFSISGTTSSNQVTSSNGSTVIPTLVGKYTCKSTTESGTCSTLYLIESYNSSYKAYAISLSSSYYSQFGTSSSYTSSNSPAYLGYMYNTVYPVNGKSYNYSIGARYTINTSHYYSDTVSYSGGEYTLTNPQPISTLSDTSELVGKYMLDNGGNTSNTTARYIVGINGTTLYYRILTSGDLNTSMMIGSSYVDNENGTYTVQSATPLTYIEWYNSNTTTLRTYNGKYVCDGASATCSNLKHIGDSTKSSYYYFGPEEGAYKYSESVSYNNGTYTLTGDIKTIWDVYDSAEKTKLSTHHYTCLSSSTTCTTVGYVTYQSSGLLYCVELTGVNDIETALTNMLSASNVNTKDSIIKTLIEAWYKNYLLLYDVYVDDTIYCNDRSIRSLGGWNPNGGSITSDLRFKGFTETNTMATDLSCSNMTDRFSVTNNSARLTYKVGLMTSAEMNLLNNDKARKIGQEYWLFSPNYFERSNAFGSSVFVSGDLYFNIPTQSIGLRPAISLIPGMRYSSGDGSMANPYVVDTSNN